MQVPWIVADSAPPCAESSGIPEAAQSPLHFWLRHLAQMEAKRNANCDAYHRRATIFFV
jgi:hypothetical protein